MIDIQLVILLAVSVSVSGQTQTQTQTPALQSLQGPTITSSACPPGSTILHTTDCTYGTSTSYCYSVPTPIQCPSGSYPGVWHPGDCIEQPTCYPVSAAWITTECSHGAVPWTTSTLYAGVLGGTSTVIRAVSCSCASDQWYSATLLSESVYTFCMPRSDCPPGMTTSTSVNTYCATAGCEGEGIWPTTTYCKCRGSSTAVYSENEPITCAA
ncbi:hypothetical protein ASPZODRAFT_13719 [Penicilliopsis zonata CBS 506.65]|uniref:Uncharacterized protein n=1 Tax=Penicilliopsis zonata CBS 506.65 TaxID=1073090 RepID=A0A1L9SP50_9EURO|nr:hypothetical protein ASPZODRAFT_13719 [Penicilliopsis zonata CBS 506.65]OJJ48978.1 hypothetical protein ASPZODRAFT_13719 [Penicilliopsis zonata CBS 506.65]